MTVLKAGQKLWWVDRKRQTEGYVIVADITEDEVSVWFNGKTEHRPHSAIGKTLFLTPQLAESKPQMTKAEPVKKRETRKRYTMQKPYTRPKIQNTQSRKKHVGYQEGMAEARFFEPTKHMGKSCDNCVLRKNGTCGSLQNDVCEDYRQIQMVSAAERNAYPQYGDATAIRRKDRKHFK